MKLEEVITAEELWQVLVEESFRKGRGTTALPMSSMKQQTAIELAVLLKVSLLSRGDDYLFSTEKEGTHVHLGLRSS